MSFSKTPWEDAEEPAQKTEKEGPPGKEGPLQRVCYPGFAGRQCPEKGVMGSVQGFWEM